MQWRAGAWVDQSTLTTPDGQPQLFESIPAADFFGTELAVARLNEDKTPEIGLWSLADGAPVSPFESVGPLTPTTSPHFRPATRTFISYLVLMALLAAVVIWRRERIVIPATLSPEQVFAALSARMTALIIDLVITAPIWASVAFWVWGGKDGFPSLAQWTDPTLTPSTPAIWTPAIIGAVYAGYGAAFELSMRTTPGKRIMRCSVVAEGGSPCSATAVLVRNAARIVEFHFAAVALLVVLTPSRQRLGDILARTVVIQPLSAEREPSDEVPDGRGPDGGDAT
jgi:uncharacterized RDD family membrane protein YckC